MPSASRKFTARRSAQPGWMNSVGDSRPARRARAAPSRPWRPSLLGLALRPPASWPAIRSRASSVVCLPRYGSDRVCGEVLGALSVPYPDGANQPLSRCSVPSTAIVSAVRPSFLRPSSAMSWRGGFRPSPSTSVNGDDGTLSIDTPRARA